MGNFVPVPGRPRGPRAQSDVVVVRAPRHRRLATRRTRCADAGRSHGPLGYPRLGSNGMLRTPGYNLAIIASGLGASNPDLLVR